MIYSEIRGNIFDADKKYYLGHCIAEDALMGAGIAIAFTEHFPGILKLQEMKLYTGTCVRIGRVLNLVTKRRSSGKPSYKSLIASLWDCRKICDKEGIKFLAFPKIGCGLDRLRWGKVKEIIKSVFQDSDIEIKVYIL